MIHWRPERASGYSRYARSRATARVGDGSGGARSSGATWVSGVTLENMVPVQQCVSDVLAEVLRQQPTSPAKVAFAWRVAVGPALDRATTVALRHNGELQVVTSDSHWRREVERAAGLIVARLERLLGSGVVRALVVDAPGR